MGRKAKAAGGKKQGPKKEDPDTLYQSAIENHNSGRAAEAAELLSQAAAQGHAEAQFNLGLMYYKGVGVPQNLKKAAELYSQAVAQGHAGAQHNLAGMYLDG